MRLILSLIVILSIPYSAALAQNSDGGSTLFVGKQGSSKCVSCGKSLTTTGATGSRPRPVSIKGILDGSSPKGARYRQSTFSFGSSDRNSNEELQKLAMENKRAQLNSAIRLGEERDAAVDAMYKQMMKEHSYLDPRNRQQGAKMSPDRSRRDEKAEPTGRVVYRKSEGRDRSAREPGSRVFLSPR